MPRRTIRSGESPTSDSTVEQSIEPPTGGTVPVIAASVVDFPAPFGPTIATISPSATSNETRVQRGDAPVARRRGPSTVSIVRPSGGAPRRRGRPRSRAGPSAPRRAALRDRAAVVEHLDAVAEAHDQRACRARSRAARSSNWPGRTLRASPAARRSRSRSARRPARRAAGTAVGGERAQRSRAGAPSPCGSERGGELPTPARVHPLEQRPCRSRAAREPEAAGRRPPTRTFSNTVRRPKSRTLWNVRPSPRTASLWGGTPVDVAAAEEDLARGRPLEAGEDVHQRGLPGAVRADQAEDLPLAEARRSRRSAP